MVLKSVTVAPNGSYKSLSVTKRVKDGWELYDYSNNLGIIKLKKKVEFNMVTNTPKVALFYAYFNSNTYRFKEKALVNAYENKNV